MPNIEQTSRTPTDQELFDQEVALFERKNWPDFRNSWFMRGEEGPRALVSAATTGGENPIELAGGMSPAWGQPYDTRVDLGSVSIKELNLMSKDLAELDEQRQEEVRQMRKQASRQQMISHFETIGGPDFAKDVIIIKPQTDHYKDRTIKGNIVCADDILRTDTYIEDNRPAFMMYSYDPNRVIGIRPADCPTIMISSVDREGKQINAVIHAGWQDEDAGFVQQGMEFLINGKGVDVTSMRTYIAAGGVEFGYTRPTNPLDGNDSSFVSDWHGRLTDVHPVNSTDPNDEKTRFTIDMIGRAVDDMKACGITDEQIFIDSTDTTDSKSGLSSNKLASRGTVAPTRDVTVLIPSRRQVVGKTDIKISV